MVTGAIYANTNQIIYSFGEDGRIINWKLDRTKKIQNKN